MPISPTPNPSGIHTPTSTQMKASLDSSQSQASFDDLLNRVDILERWSELAIRPATDECPVEDLDLLQQNQDDIQQLQARCLQARSIMNDNLPPHELAQDMHLTPKKSQIQQADKGLFYCPSLSSASTSTSTSASSEPLILKKGQTICYYTGHRHTFRSSKILKDKSYLMLVQGNTFVDPRPLLNIKARYINDPLNERFVNCKYVPHLDRYRCAVVATRDIRAQEEIFASYGDMYWANQLITATIFHG